MEDFSRTLVLRWLIFPHLFISLFSSLRSWHIWMRAYISALHHQPHSVLKSVPNTRMGEKISWSEFLHWIGRESHEWKSRDRMRAADWSPAATEILFLLPPPPLHPPTSPPTTTTTRPPLSPSLFFLLWLSGRRPKNVPVADVWTEGVCMLFIYTLPYGTQYDHHNNQ